jgi:lysophosphatidate acyltransferase
LSSSTKRFSIELEKAEHAPEQRSPVRHQIGYLRSVRKLEGIIRLSLGISWVLGTASILVLMLLFLLPWRAARIRLCNHYGRLMSPLVLWVVRARVQIIGKEHLVDAPPAIYVSNHTSMTDIFIGMWVCPVGGVGIAKKEVAKIPFFGWAYRLSGHLLIDRQNRDRAIAGLKETGQVVRDLGMSIWMWPEGTRSKDGRLRPLKKGFVHLAIATGLPVVPVVVCGAQKNWPLKEMTSFYLTDIPIHVLEPIDTSAWSVETMDQHLEEVHAAMAGRLPPDQKPMAQVESV